MRTLNEAGRKILIEREGIYLKPYLCPAGIPTIGIGTTFYLDGTKVTLKDPPITESQAYELLNHELQEKSMMIEKWANKRELIFNDNQFSALLCFAYNLGCGPIIDGGRSLNAALLANYDIRKAFMMYVKAKNRFGIMVTLKGLVTRRKQEADLYFS